MDRSKINRELRLRQGSGQGYYSGKRSPFLKTGKDRLMNKSIVSVVILICVMLLKLSSSAYAENVLGSLKALISKQMDYKAVGESALSAFNSFLDDIEAGKNASFASAKKLELVAPLAEGKITQSFTPGEHPLFSVQTEPVGITVASSSGAFVNCSLDGVLTNKTQNADGSFRVSVLSSEEVNIVYDKLDVCYFNVNDTVLAGQLLGALRQGEQGAELVFCVYIKGEAENPADYLGEIYN